jgi:hypothetical protein
MIENDSAAGFMNDKRPGSLRCASSSSRAAAGLFPKECRVCILISCFSLENVLRGKHRNRVQTLQDPAAGIAWQPELGPVWEPEMGPVWQPEMGRCLTSGRVLLAALTVSESGHMPCRSASWSPGNALRRKAKVLVARLRPRQILQSP